MATQRDGGLVAWQWSGYGAAHRDRVNLLVHMVAVPALVASILAGVYLAWHQLWPSAAVAFGLAVVAFAAQGLGHRRESQKPVPFAGPGDFAARVIAEQFISFPRFVLSGNGWRNLAQSD